VTRIPLAPSDHRATGTRTGHDPTARRIAVLSAILSVSAFLYFSYRGETLAYFDSIAHVEIARRVVDSPTNGLAQLGSVWLPLPHLLALPLVWIDALYYSGISMIVISMAAYVTTCVLLYKSVLDLTHHRIAGLAGMSVFALNPNVLYMQSTPMTELLLFACLAGMVHAVQRWITSDHYRYLVWAGAWGLAGSLTRYEAWVLLAALTAVVAWVAWRRHHSYPRVEGATLAFVLIGGVGIVGWFLWNLLLFGDPLNFQRGEYARPALWVGQSDATVGDWGVASTTYFYAMVDNVGYPVLAGLALGVVILVLRERLNLRTLPVLSYAFVLAFFVIALEEGQRPLHVLQYSASLYNVRFGLLVVLPAAVLIGYLVGAVAGRPSGVRGVVAVVVPVVVMVQLGWGLMDPQVRIMTLRDPAETITATSGASDAASEFLRDNYDGGLVLMESFGNERVLFRARIAPGQNLYEGSYRMWEPALNDPGQLDVRWIVMRGPEQPDKVFEALHGDSDLSSYREVFRNSAYSIFQASP
jgi:Dolichyl-phosphate-mannose-protein mannosyltransferase